MNVLREEIIYYPSLYLHYEQHAKLRVCLSYMCSELSGKKEISKIFL